jgi:hypothetical protein
MLIGALGGTGAIVGVATILGDPLALGFALIGQKRGWGPIAGAVCADAAMGARWMWVARSGWRDADPILATTTASTSTTEGDERGLRGDALGGAGLHLIQKKHFLGMIKGNTPGVGEQDFTSHVMVLVQPTHEHGDKGVIDRRLLAVMEGIHDGLDLGAVLRHAKVPLTLFVHVSSEVDSALTMIVEEDVCQGEVEVPRRIRAVHDHPGEFPRDGSVDLSF